MKINTAPFLPFNELSECSVPSASGNLKSSMVAPMAGVQGKSLLRPLPAIAAKTIIRREARKKEIAYCFFMPKKLLSRMGDFLKAKSNSEKLDVASGRLVR